MDILESNLRFYLQLQFCRGNLKIEKLKILAALVTEKLGNPSMTRLLKFLYLIDERSIKTLGYSISDQKYQLWQMGPVLQFLYKDLAHNNGKIFSDVLNVKYHGNKCKLTSKHIGIDHPSELSKKELEIINNVIEEYFNCTTKDIISELHNENSLWRKTAKENDLLETLENGDLKTTPIELNFKDLLDGDQFLIDKFEADEEDREFIEALAIGV